MPSIQLDTESRQYLEALYDRSGGDTTAQVSMYELGEGIGMDRDASAAIAQELMGLGLVEIRTLSGGIGLSPESLAFFGAGDAGAEPGGDRLGLGDMPTLEAPRIEAVAQALGEVRAAVGEMGISFEALSDLIADVRTIEAQLTASQPKTDVVRQCLSGIRSLGGPLPQGKWRASIDALLSG